MLVDPAMGDAGMTIGFPNSPPYTLYSPSPGGGSIPSSPVSQVVSAGFVVLFALEYSCLVNHSVIRVSLSYFFWSTTIENYPYFLVQLALVSIFMSYA